MNKTQATIALVATVAVIAVVAILASAYILTDGNPGNDGQVATIFSFAAGLAAGIFLITKQLMALHDTVNSRLDQLLEARGAAAHAAGKKEGMEGERAHPMTEQQQVTLVADPDNPVPVKPVS